MAEAGRLPGTNSAAALLLLLTTALGVSASSLFQHAPTPYVASFKHGVSCGLGSADSNAIYAWVTVEPREASNPLLVLLEVPLEWQVSVSLTFATDTMVASGEVLATPSLHGNQVALRAEVLVDGLAAEQQYFYRFKVAPDGPVSAIGSFITPLHAAGVTAKGSTKGHIAAHVGELHNRRLAEVAGSTVNFQLLHINDQHNRVDAIKSTGQSCTEGDEMAGVCIGGFGRLATFIGQKRAEKPTLVLDAGDQSTGTLWDVTYSNHSATAAAQNFIRFDAMTLGNHEFDNGVELLAEYIQQLDQPILGACNIDVSLEPSLVGKVQRWTVVEVAAGIKVGVIGYHTVETAYQTGRGKVRFNDPVLSMKSCVADFKVANPDVNIIIGLSHAGYLEDQRVASEVPDLDLIVGGHSHTFLWGSSTLERGPALVAGDPTSGELSAGPYPTYVSGPTGRQVPVVQAQCWSKYVGALDLTFSSSGDLISATGAPVLLGGALSSSPVTRQPEMLTLLSNYSGAVNAMAAIPVGFLANNLTAARNVVRTREAPLGNLLCDSLVETTQLETDYKPTICIVNGGALRADLNAGNVTSGNILTMLPFGDAIYVKEITGLALLTALENGLLGNFLAGETRGSFVQVAGIRYTFNVTAPPWKRVMDIQVRQVDDSYAALDLCATYQMVTTSYVSNGGDGFQSIKAAKNLYAMGPSVAISLAKYIQRHSPVTGYAAAEARISRCDPTPPAEGNPASCALPPTDFGSCPINLTLMHCNDVHSRVEGSKIFGSKCSEADEAAGVCFGGMARLAKVVQSVKADENGTHLLLDAGDVSSGTVWDIAFPDRRPTAAIQNTLGIGALTLGDHEFDGGAEALVSYLKQLNFPVLGCNIDASASSPSLFGLIQKYTVVELGSTGIRAGIVGWITQSTSITSPGGSNVTFKPVLQSVKEAVSVLKAEYADTIKIIIGLSHGGYASDLEVAAQVGDIDMIVGGHDHYFLYGNGTGAGPRLFANVSNSGQMPYAAYPTVVDSAVVPGKKVLVAQAYYALYYLGLLNLTFDRAGDLVSHAGQPVLLGAAVSANPVERDSATMQLIDSLKPGLSALNSTVIGSNPTKLKFKMTTVRSQESPLGNLVCDAMRWYLTKKARLPRVDACILNSGSIRAGLQTGNVTPGDVVDMLPFSDTLTVVNMTGAQIVQALENGVSIDLDDRSLLVNDGRFPQVSGIKFTFDLSLKPFRRVLNASYAHTEKGGRTSWKPLQRCRFYTVVTSNYMAGGGDGYNTIQSAPRVLDKGTTNVVSLIEYVKAANPLPASVEGRSLRCSGLPKPGCPIRRTASAVCPKYSQE